MKILKARVIINVESILLVAQNIYLDQYEIIRAFTLLEVDHSLMLSVFIWIENEAIRGCYNFLVVLVDIRFVGYG